MTAREFLTSRLTASGLTAADAEQLGIKPLEKAPLSIAKAGPGFQIPYYDKKGKRLSTFRYRRDLDRLTGWDKLTDTPKYLQPPATPPEIYLAPFKTHKWEKRLADSSIDMFITEGELKAAAACKQDLTCIGLGGVWSWMSKRNGHFLLPALRDISWHERVVYIVYDSDAVSNPQVAKAEAALCAALRELKAEPVVVRLPTLQGQTKTGLDDYLLAVGKEVFLELCEKTPGDELTREIDRLNMDNVYVHSRKEIYDLTTGSFVQSNKFVNLVYANRRVKQMVNSKTSYISVAKEWLLSNRRAEVDDLMFVPGGSDILHTTVRTKHGRRNVKALNTWKGWGCDSPKKGDVSLFTELLDYFCQNETKEARRWLEQWFAYPVQFPGKKLYSAVVIWSSETGTGKSFLGEIVGAIYGEGYTAVTHSMLEKNFNGWAENRQFIMGSEITGNDSRRFADQLKDMITRSKLHVEKKYFDSYEMDDYSNYYFTSNHPDAFFLEDKDRRFFVIDGSFAPLPAAFYKKCDEYFKSEEGIAALMYHFQHLDMTDFNPTAKALETSAKQTMAEQGRSNVSQWMHDFVYNRPAAVTRTVKGMETFVDCKIFTSKEVFRAYQVEHDDDRRSTSVTISKAMSSLGLKKISRNQITTKKSGREYLWYDPNATPHLGKLSNEQLAKLFDEERRTIDRQKERKF